MGKASSAKKERRRTQRTPAESLDALKEQFELLISACAGFDDLRFVEAKRISVDLRILLHDTRSSTSLLQQLGVKDQLRFEDTCGPLSPDVVMTSGALAVPATSRGWGDWIPLYERRSLGPDSHFDRSRKPFGDWWGEIIFQDQKKAQYSRKNLVTWLSNQDGGAHVDPAPDAQYVDLSRNNSLGWQKASILAPGAFSSLSSPVPASVRQIAHEVVRTCQWELEEGLVNAGINRSAARSAVKPLAGYSTPIDVSIEPDGQPLEKAPDAAEAGEFES